MHQVSNGRKLVQLRASAYEVSDTRHFFPTSRDHHITITSQVYNEQVIDLLNPEAGPLGVRESKSHGFFIENLLIVTCETQQDVMEVGGGGGGGVGGDGGGDGGDGGGGGGGHYKL